MTLRDWLNQGDAQERARRFARLAEYACVGMSTINRFTSSEAKNVPMKYWRPFYRATDGQVTCFDMYGGLRELIEETGEEK